MKCPKCNWSVESTGNTPQSRTLVCPDCGESLSGAFDPPVMPASPGSLDRPVSAARQWDPSTLRDPLEGKAFAWLAFFSAFAWVFLAMWVASTFGAALLLIGLVAGVRKMAELFAVAHIKTNAVEVSERQFPEIHRIATTFARQVGQPVPTIYIIQENTWNALAMRITGKRLVVLFSGAVDSILNKGSLTQLAWVIGHEMGHHYAGHLDFWRSMTVQLGSWFVWVRLWHSRRCEFTCDRYGLACAENLQESLRTVCNMSVGSHLAPQVDIEEAIAQWNRHRSEFFVRYRTIYSTHPHTLCRLDQLKKAAHELGVS
ncbi:MAG: M48 family peptidase [Pedosphaera sp.]|nr:M48 family peptidase [Pedosphaera sp.]